MTNYDGLSCENGTHTLRVHLQNEKYRGYIDYEIAGNCKGLSILSFDFECYDADDVAEMSLHNLEIKGTDYSEQWFYLKIYDDDNHTDWIEGEYEASDLNNMIVGLEIISFESEGDDDNEK